jgi:MATE family multidrug resistance protein
MLGQAGHMITGIADSVMAGALGGNALAAVSFANSVFILFFIMGIGFANGVTPLVGAAYGEKNYYKCGDILKNAIPANILIGLLLTLPVWLAKFSFPYLGQDAEVVRLAGPYYDTLIWGLLPYMMFLCGKQFLEGLAITMPGMIISLVCNLENIVLNYILMFGKLGMPEMGVVGAGVATSISRATMGAAILIYIFTKSDFKDYFKSMKIIGMSKGIFYKVIKFGVPVAVQHTTEVWAFAFGGIMAGWFGAKALAAHQIAMSMASLTFMAATGLGSAATIRLSSILGEKKYKEIRTTYLSNYYMTIGFMLIGAVIFIFFGHNIAACYVQDPEIIAIAANLLIITGLFEIFDGSQVIGLGALRGLHDVKFPTVIAFTSYWAILLPAAYLLSVVFKFGVYGIWFGFLFGLIAAAIILFTRLEIIRKRLLKRVEI